MTVAPEVLDQSVGAKVQRALDKQASIVSSLATAEDIGEVKSALSDVIDQLRSLTDETAPNKIVATPGKTDQTMIDEQVASQFRAMQEGFTRQLAELEAKLNLQPGPANDVEPDPLERVAEHLCTEDHRQILAEARKYKRVGDHIVHDRMPNMLIDHDAVSMIRDVVGLAELQALTPRFRRGEIVRHLREPTDIASLFRRVPVPSDRYEFGRQTFVGLHGSINTQVDGAFGLGTETAIDVLDGSIFSDNDFVEFHTSAGVIGKFVTVAADTLTIYDAVGGAPSALGVALAGGEQVTSEWYKATAEEGEKPEGFDEYEEIEQALIMLATHLPTTEQRLHFAPTFRTFMSTELRTRLMRNLDGQILYGAGDGTATATQLPGLASETGVQTLAWSTGDAEDSRADLILRMADLIFAEDNAMMTAIMGRADWTAMIKAKATDGHYVTNRGPVMLVDEPGRRFVGPHMVRRSGKVRSGNVFLIEPMATADLVDGGNAKLSLGYNNDDFRRNKVAMRYEQSLLFAILSTTGYVLGTWDSQP